MILVKGDFLRSQGGACVRGRDERCMCGECVKLKDRCASGSRQCCTIGLKVKQPDLKNV